MKTAIKGFWNINNNKQPQKGFKILITNFGLDDSSHHAQPHITVYQHEEMFYIC
jgi:hypothetical protein